MDIESIRKFFENDRFAWENGMRIEKAEPGSATCTLTLTSRHRNACGGVQGGAIFTLADFAFAVAANCAGKMTVSLSVTANFLKNTEGERLTAYAKERGGQGRICLYDVAVTDNLGALVSQMTVTGYRKNMDIEF